MSGVSLLNCAGSSLVAPFAADEAQRANDPIGSVRLIVARMVDAVRHRDFVKVERADANQARAFTPYSFGFESRRWCV